MFKTRKLLRQYKICTFKLYSGWGWELYVRQDGDWYFLKEQSRGNSMQGLAWFRGTAFARARAAARAEDKEYARLRDDERKCKIIGRT